MSAGVGFDLEALTVLDVMDLEESLGMSLTEIGEAMQDPASPKGRLMAHLAWINARHDDPDISLQDAARRVTVKSFAADNQEPPPFAPPPGDESQSSP